MPFIAMKARQKKSEPSWGIEPFERFSEKWQCVRIVNIARIHCTSIKVAVYDIMAISRGAQTRPIRGQR
jgi:hypothetical protein